MLALSLLLSLAALPSALGQSITDQSIEHSLDQPILQAANDVAFQLITKSAPWAARGDFSLNLLNRSVVGENPTSGNPRVTLPSPVLILSGGQVWDPSFNTSVGLSNDVWASTDGKTWIFASGVTQDGSQAPGNAAETSFTNRRGASSASFIAKTKLYRIGGQRYDGKQTLVDEVWTSTDALRWDDESMNSWSPISALMYSSATADAAGLLFVVGGYDNVATGRLSWSQDVWMSTNDGLEWRLQTSEATFGPRVSASSVSLPINQAIDQSVISESTAQALIVMGGQTPEGKSNEVWMSTDRGVTWSMMSSRAPWSRRSNANALITKDGLIVLVGGVEDIVPGKQSVDRSNERPTNDVWVSPNGGWTWHRCASAVGWSNRRDNQAIIDSRGFLMVMGGYQIESPDPYNPFSGEMNDVWRSAISFHDLDAVSSACNVEIPRCGAGLKCVYSPDTVVSADSSYVSCSACDINDEATKKQVTYLWVAISFAIAGCSGFLIAIFALVCVIKRSKMTPADQANHAIAWAEANVSSQSTSETAPSTNQQWWPSDRGHEPIQIQTNDMYDSAQPSTEFTPMRN